MMAAWFGAGAAMVALPVWARGRFAAFGAQGPGDYLDAPGEMFDPRHHLSGEMGIDGVIYGPTGRVTSRFSGDFHGIWQGNEGVLKETYRYASGQVEDREWRLRLGNDMTLRAEAPDVPGGARGRICGPTVQMRYRLKLGEDAGGHVLRATDWMYLSPDGAVVNRSQFRKFGLKVAELVAVIRPKETT